MIRRTTDEEIDVGQNRLAALFEQSEAKKPPVEIENVEAIQRLLIGSTFPYQGRLWNCPRLPFEVGIELKKLEIEVKRVAKYAMSGIALDEYKMYAQRIARQVWPVLWPTDARGRLKKRLGLMRNPFLKASEAELGGVLGFCLAHRMASTLVADRKSSSEA
jgi:hypothetical protein